VIEAGQLWKSCCDELRIQVSEAAWLSCFDAVTATEVNGDSLVLAAPSPQVREKLEGRYKGMIEDVVQQKSGLPLVVQVLVQDPQPARDHDEDDDDDRGPRDDSPRWSAPADRDRP
jgi:chromosomal replication initiation ATPase DnaA